MVALIRTWDFSPNQDDSNPDTLAAPANQSEQYRNLVLRMKRYIVARGWTVVSSSNGVTASAADNWATVADIVFNTNGNAHSWIVLQSPAAFHAGSGNSTYLLIACENPSGDATPDILEIYKSTADWTGGTNTNNPTTAGTNSNFVNNSFLPTAFNAQTLHMLGTTVGEFYIFVSEDGSGLVETLLAFPRPDNGEAVQWPGIGFFDRSPSGLILTNIESNVNWEGFNESGLVALSGLSWRSTVSQSTTANWTNGNSNISASAPDASVDIINNQVAQCGYYGRIIDVRASAQGVTDGDNQQGDPDPFVRYKLGPLWVPFPAGTVLTL